MNHLIYAWLDDKGDPFYVGKTSDLQKRHRYHKSVVRSTRDRSKTRSYRKLKSLIERGNIWLVEILENNIPGHLSSDREKHWIATLRDQGFDLCNHTDGGDGGDVFSSKSKEEMKQICKRMSIAQIRKNNEASEEQKKAWADSKRGLKRSAATRRKMSESRKGIKFSDEHKNNLSIARKKRVTTEETKSKCSNTSAGKINIKKYELTSPDGETYITTKGLAEFCRQHGLTPANLMKVLSGDRAHHKDWTIKRG